MLASSLMPRAHVWPWFMPEPWHERIYSKTSHFSHLVHYHSIAIIFSLAVDIPLRSHYGIFLPKKSDHPVFPSNLQLTWKGSSQKPGSRHPTLLHTTASHFRDTAPASPFLSTLQYRFKLVLLSFVFQRFITGKTIIWKVVCMNVLWSIKSLNLELGK